MANTSITSSKPSTGPKQKGNTGIDDNPKISRGKTSLPGGRVSQTNNPYNSKFTQYTSITPDYIREIIPIIRQLMMRNEDVGQAIHNIITLGNTGHKIFFDRKRSPEQVDQMRNHLINQRKTWASGQAGMDGLINRFFAQMLIGGAISAEWVPNQELTGIESVILVNPEEIQFVLDKRQTKYLPHQRIINGNVLIKSKNITLIPLNTNTYRYFALNGDGELPYGFPPYMSVIPRIESQVKMNKNIDFVVDQLGLMGFIEALISKPEQGEQDDSAYDVELDTLLIQARARLLEGFKEGVVVGYEGDHTFKFNTASKSYDSAVAMYNNNELMIASGLKQDASLWGRSYATSETQITVVFVKMLSELKNMHNLLKGMIEFGYALELRLAGYEFDSLEIKFNRSTIQDDLKYQQADEIKIRNVKDKLILGIISQEQAADELGYEISDSPEPMVSWDVLAGGTDPAVAASGLATDATKKKADTNKKKTASDTKKRQQAKILPK